MRFQSVNNNWVFENAYSTVAEQPVQYLLESQNLIVNNIDLGLSLSVSIPPNSRTNVIVNYSIPLGLTESTANPLGYMGVRFLKNNVEAPAGSRKFAITTKPSITDGTIRRIYYMSTLNATFVEEIVNTFENPIVVEYKLNGYIEQRHSGVVTTTPSVNYIYNMWSETGDNFNWGKANMQAQVYRKNL